MTDVIEVRANVKVSTVLRYLRQMQTLPPQTDVLMVVDRQGTYRGALPLSALVTSGLDTRVADVMRTDLAGIPVAIPGTEVARLFQERDLVSAPVVDEVSRLVGRITVDDVVDLIREDSERTMMQVAGLAGSQMLTLVIRSLALGPVQKGYLPELINRELGISVLNGLLWAGVIALLAVAWFGDWGLGGVLGIAILTTVTDLIGFFAFRGLATWWLL